MVENATLDFWVGIGGEFHEPQWNLTTIAADLDALENVTDGTLVYFDSILAIWWVSVDDTSVDEYVTLELVLTYFRSKGFEVEFVTMPGATTVRGPV